MNAKNSTATPASTFVRYSKIAMTVGVLAGLAIVAGSRAFRHDPERLKAWETVRVRLDKADQDAALARDDALEPLKTFFDERRAKAREFADEVLSLSGKFEYVKSFFGEEGSHENYLRESFERIVFSPDELKAVVEEALDGSAAEAEALENRLLAEVRADLGRGALADSETIHAALRSDEAFRRVFDELVERLLPQLAGDVGVKVGVFVASEVAAQVALDVVAAAASKLGVAGGVLGSGAASSAATLGAGLVVSIVVDRIVDWVAVQAGYDPAGEIADKVGAAIDRLAALLIDGDPQKIDEYERLKSSWWSGDKARDLERSGELGLRRELARLHELRAQVRRAALQKLVLDDSSF